MTGMSENKESQADRLQFIHDRDGLLTPEAVVKDAKRKASPLHDYFDWSVESAARKYNIQQARILITSVQVVVSTKKHQIKVPAYIREPDCEHNEQGYSKINEIMTDEDRAEKYLTQKLEHAEKAMEQALDYAEVLKIPKEVNRILKAIRNVHLKLVA